MPSTLRNLLIQRAARLQDRPALTAPDWGTLTYAQLRNRAEGVALGLLAGDPPAAVFAATGSAWDWAVELAAAAAGLRWEGASAAVPAEVLGGPRFNAEGGRGPYHDRESLVLPATPFHAGLTQGELMARLRRLNVALGWDHTTRVELPFATMGEATLRAALWSALYAGAHAVLQPPADTVCGGFLPWRKPANPPWDPGPFQGLWTAP